MSLPHTFWTTKQGFRQKYRDLHDLKAGWLGRSGQHTTALPAGTDEYRLAGHKWFTSAPMCDAFLVLAQAPEGLSCFLLPRFLPDGSQNPIRLVRLKVKLGNHR